MSLMSSNLPPQHQSMPTCNYNNPNIGIVKPITANDKIYPHDQPYITNSQNPSAPPTYTCGKCHKEVNDNEEALFCENSCKFFYHR